MPDQRLRESLYPSRICHRSPAVATYLLAVALIACGGNEDKGDSASGFLPVLQLIAGDIGGVGGVMVDGPSAIARFYGPESISADTAGNLYVTDCAKVRKITPAGVVSTLTGTAVCVPIPHPSVDPTGGVGVTPDIGAASPFVALGGIAADAAGNLYVTDPARHNVSRITPEGAVTTLAGMAGVQGSADGIGSAARFRAPAGITTDQIGNLYVAERGNPTIRKISPAGVVTTLAGAAGGFGFEDGTGSAAKFSGLEGITADGAGNLYVAEYGNSTIRKITPVGVVTTLAGMAGVTGNADGTGSAARFNYPTDITTDGTGNLYVADGFNHTIRKVTSAGVVTTVAGVAGRRGIVLGSLPGGLDHPSGMTALEANVLAIVTGHSVLRLVLP